MVRETVSVVKMESLVNHYVPGSVHMVRMCETTAKKVNVSKTNKLPTLYATFSSGSRMQVRMTY